MSERANLAVDLVAELISVIRELNRVIERYQVIEFASEGVAWQARTGERPPAGPDYARDVEAIERGLQVAPIEEPA